MKFNYKEIIDKGMKGDNNSLIIIGSFVILFAIFILILKLLVPIFIIFGIGILAYTLIKMKKEKNDKTNKKGN